MASRSIKYLLISFMVCSGLFCCSLVYSQQMPRHSLERYFAQRINPAYAGSDDLFNIVLITRQQWVGFEGAPTSYIVSTNISLRDKRAGIGLDFQQQQSGPVNLSGLFANYAYTIKIGDESSISFGIRGGINIYNINLNGLFVNDPGDFLFENDFENRVLPNFGIGFHFHTGNYFADFAIPMLLRNDFNTELSGKEIKLSREDRLYHIKTGAAYSISPEIVMEPWVSAWYLRGSPPVIDIHIDAVIFDVAEGGLSYRVMSGFGGFISYRITKAMLLGYSYELPLVNDFGLQTGTHEVLLGFNIGFLKGKTLSPRRF